MLENEPLVSVIILEYNNYEDTVVCIESVLLSSYSNYKIVVVDNYSDINIFNKLKIKYSNSDLVHVIRSKRNGGYGYGNNYGMKYAEKMNPDYYFIVSNDTIIEQNTISLLVKYIEGESKLGIVFPKILYYKDKKTDIVNSVGGNFCKFGFANDKFFFERYDKIKHKINNSFFYAPGSAFLIREKVIKEIRYFDENIFMYWDDVDLSWRTRLINYDIHIVQDATIYHKLFVSSGKSKNKFKVYHREYGWLYVIFKNLSMKNFFKYSIFYSIFMLMRLIYNCKSKDLLEATIGAYTRFIIQFRYNIKKHKLVQKNRIVTDDEILKHHSLSPMKQSFKFKGTG